ncbi:MAG TPA: flagellar motor switch protein FliG [Syntrophales bacterium]|nr:flagellar motor switch protein FliG [Syntrophales bacterium]
MTNEEKAAVLLLALEEDLAAEVMKNLSPSEIRRIGKQMGRITSIPAEMVSSVTKEFCALAKGQWNGVAVSGDTSKKIFMKALGEKEAQEILTAISSTKSFDNPIIEKLRDVDPKMLADFTKSEHPQTIALILVHLRPEQAAQMLEHFTPELQSEITRRMATLKAVPQEFIEEVANTLEKEIAVGAVADQKLGGARLMGEILNRMNRASESAIMSNLEESEPELAAEIRNFMFNFEDVLKLDDRSIQELLRETSSEELSRALKLVDENMREKIYRNMSKRGAEMLREEIEMMPPIRLSEVEASQRKIVETTKKMETEGKIVIQRGAEEDAFV